MNLRKNKLSKTDVQDHIQDHIQAQGLGQAQKKDPDQVQETEEVVVT